MFSRVDDGLARRGRRAARALRLGREQRPRIGMGGRGEDARDGSGLDDAALLHHRDVVGDLAHDVEVVGDEQHRHAVARLQALQQLEDLRLHGDVERGGRLVGDEEIGAVGERHGDHDALALAAGQLMRIGAEPLGGIGNADLLEQLDRRGRGCRRRRARHAVRGFRRSASRSCAAD